MKLRTWISSRFYQRPTATAGKNLGFVNESLISVVERIDLLANSGIGDGSDSLCTAGSGRVVCQSPHVTLAVDRNMAALFCQP